MVKKSKTITKPSLAPEDILGIGVGLTRGLEDLNTEKKVHVIASNPFDTQAANLSIKILNQQLKNDTRKI